MAFWGDMLKAWPSDVVKKMGLSREDTDYLVEVGLPVAMPLYIPMPPPAAGSEPEMYDGLPVLTHDHHTPVCLDPSRGGRVMMMCKDRPFLINSNVRCLGAFLMIFQDYLVRSRAYDPDDDDGRGVLVTEIEQRMRAADPGAMRDAGDGWPMTIMEMRLGNT
jgi:hypothetical protein